jgi:membrane-bound metal-dependent hydrolase YbcI (DUF457 family)
LKGVAHFVTGVAVATFFPQVVESAAQSLSFAPLLGGLAGLLPDTLDFKFVRYFYRVDDEIDPERNRTAAGHPDPQVMADRIAAALDRTYESRDQVRLRLHTMQLGADRWRQYTVTLDVAGSQVVVHLGPVVSTGQVPYPDTEIPDLDPGRAYCRARILPTYDSEIRIDAFTGPVLAFDRVDDGVQVTFLPWHRLWTHSWIVVLLLGAIGALIAPVIGLVMALASLLHIIEDQMGYMGSNLFFPLTRQRVNGLRWMRSGDAIPNFLTVWLGLACILLNLDRFSGAPQIPVGPYVLGVIGVPCLLVLGLGAWHRWPGRQPSGPVLPALTAAAIGAVEALDEGEEVDI